jgi:predicted HD phosphohydrolase
MQIYDTYHQQTKQKHKYFANICKIKSNCLKAKGKEKVIKRLLHLIRRPFASLGVHFRILDVDFRWNNARYFPDVPAIEPAAGAQAALWPDFRPAKVDAAP